MDNYILFLDEANPAKPKNPFFCLAGMIIKRDVYENTLIHEINQLKMKYFSDTSIIFHYADMKKNVNEFSIFQNEGTRTAFWLEFNKVLANIDFITIGTYLQYDDFKKVYGFGKNKHYDIAFTRLINNYITFLKRNNDMGAIVIESRQWKENSDIQELFTNILSNGTDMYTAEECKKYLSTLGFFIKKDNCIGLQIADFIPDSFIRDINGARNFHNVKVNFINKQLSVGGQYKNILGLNRII